MPLPHALLTSLRRGNGAVTLGVFALGLAGCAGGGPLLHPAKTLDKGEVRAAAGLSGQALASGFADAFRNAEAEAARSPNTPTDATYAKGALVAAAVDPGIAPFLGARVGIGWESEGGLAFTGRGARIDVRRSFRFGEENKYALSIGVGGSGALYGQVQGSRLPGVTLTDLRGYGADVPVLLGYEADGGLYMAWIGLRGGWEHDSIGPLTSDGGPGLTPSPIGLSADRFWGGALVGAAAGFRHIHVALELQATYETISGSFGGNSATLTGVAFVPATALWWDF